MSDSINEQTTGVLQPDILPPQQLNTIAKRSPLYSTLHPTQKAVLIAMMNDFMSETIRTDTEMAADLSVDRKTIYNCRTNSTFNAVMTSIMPEMVQAKLPKYLLQIEKHGEKDYKPLEFLIKYAGLYVDRHQNVNLNANISAQDIPQTPKEVLERHLIKYISIGYDWDRYMTEAHDLWTMLQAEGV